MLAGAFSPPVSPSTQRGQALLQRRMQIAHAGKRRRPVMDSHFSSERICANRVGSRKGRYKLITQKGPNMIAEANVVKASPP